MTDSPNVTPPAPHVDPATAVKMPAMLLLATGGLGIVMMIVLIIVNLAGAGLGAMNGNGGIFQILWSGLGAVFGIIGIIVGVVIIIGALKMQKLKSLGFVKISCYLAMIPCTSPCCMLGLPAGFLALQALGKPEVIAAFEGK